MCSPNIIHFTIIIIIGECQCDSGTTNSTCQVSNDNPQTVISDFDGPINPIPFPVIYGAALSTECGILSSDRSLVFKYVCKLSFLQ